MKLSSKVVLRLKSLNSKSIKMISEAIAAKFDKVASDFLGVIPVVKGKRIILSAQPKSLSSLFVGALGHAPNVVEKNTLKALLSVSNSYLNAVKEQTIAKILNDINGYLTEQVFSETEGTVKKIKQIISNELNTTDKKLELILGAETNKSMNIATALNIKKIGEERGIDDPVVFWSVVIDERNDPETYRLHLLPDRLTPRCYFLSEIKGGYHKKGDKWPKFAGTNPNCRCKLNLLMPGYGWKNGKLSYISPDYNALEEQRKEFGMP